MREKRKAVKTKKIIVRINQDEKKVANELSHKAGMNTSEYIRSLLKEAQNNEHLSLHLKIVEKYEKTLGELRTVLKEAKRKGNG